MFALMQQAASTIAAITQSAPAPTPDAPGFVITYGQVFFAGIVTLIVALLGFWFYRHKNKGEGAQAVAKGEQEELKVEEQKSDLELKLEQNEIKKRTVSIDVIKQLVETAEKSAADLMVSLDTQRETNSRYHKILDLSEQQARTIDRQNGIIENQWNRHELLIRKLAAEESGHSDCLERVRELEKRVSGLENPSIN